MSVDSMSIERLRSIIEPVVSGAGMDLEDLRIERVGRRDKVSVIVDADGGANLDAIAEVSTALSAALDEHDDIASSPYVLEVSSPGVDRPLTLPRHWRRNRDRLVAVELVDGTTLTGRVIGSDEDAVTLDIDGHEREIELPSVRRAIVQVEFAPRDRKED